MLDLENSNCLDYVPGPEKKIWKRLICTANGQETMFWSQGKKTKWQVFINLGLPFGWVTQVSSDSSHTNGAHLNTNAFLTKF